jgi:hypothetical protein
VIEGERILKRGRLIILKGYMDRARWNAPRAIFVDKAVFSDDFTVRTRSQVDSEGNRGKVTASKSHR